MSRVLGIGCYFFNGFLGLLANFFLELRRGSDSVKAVANQPLRSDSKKITLLPNMDAALSSRRRTAAERQLYSKRSHGRDSFASCKRQTISNEDAWKRRAVTVTTEFQNRALHLQFMHTLKTADYATALEAINDAILGRGLWRDHEDGGDTLLNLNVQNISLCTTFEGILKCLDRSARHHTPLEPKVEEEFIRLVLSTMNSELCNAFQENVLTVAIRSRILWYFRSKIIAALLPGTEYRINNRLRSDLPLLIAAEKYDATAEELLFLIKKGCNPEIRDCKTGMNFIHLLVKERNVAALTGLVLKGFTIDAFQPAYIDVAASVDIPMTSLVGDDYFDDDEDHHYSHSGTATAEFIQELQYAWMHNFAPCVFQLLRDKLVDDVASICLNYVSGGDIQYKCRSPAY